MVELKQNRRATKTLLPQVAPSKTTSYDAASKSIKSKTVSECRHADNERNNTRSGSRNGLE